ncbi:fumarylacetoacetate hydrolase family protein [Roseovarius sp. EGI FJ00037]|uniref:fumarylacetoacetate hydrolase family protein n=1 Tax=Roseovarius salincola TaxID=2978479 RepID=UPI0022A8A0BF|nr:fumarylacetoacetate hydrolase family protein [Roseovarius sp. EGI FJ00037]MCZ0814115.1 fumarylacetoacetate hydrolase family protein [Roseovarius sp. EGI FJ00037]
MTNDTLLFDPPAMPLVPVKGDSRQFPLRRIFCVGRNYAAHAAEMGNEVDREAPFYFTKSAHALCLSGASIPYSLGTQDCHYEMELVVAIGASALKVGPDEAMKVVMGFACGIDLTRRDLQGAAKDKRRPWDLGKDFENAALIGAITPADEFGKPADRRIALLHDGAVAQEARLSDMVWSVPEVIAHLSGFYHLLPGDLIYTGTPAGVGPVHPGSVLRGEIDGLEPVEVAIAPAL